MASVLSLIAAPMKARLAVSDVERARHTLEMAGAHGGPTAWLAAEEACDIAFAGSERDVLAAVRAELGGRPIDVNVVAQEPRRKRLLLADMDSTMIEQECIDELAAEIGLGPEVAAITERAMRGEIEFEPALRQRVALLRGISADVAAKLLAERITVMPGANVLVATMRAAGAHTALVSGGFTLFAGPIGRKIGFDEHRANTLLAEAGAFTGSVGEPILGRGGKEQALLDLTARLKLDRRETLAVGDGANDLGMIRLAGLGVAYRAKPAVRAGADAAIDHADLTGLLFLQGYRREEFVSGPATAS